MFKNENNVNYPLNVKVNGKFCLISTSIVLNKVEGEWEAFTDYILTGELMATENVNGETVKLLRNNTVVDETTVDTSGAFSFNINTGANTGDVEYQVIHEKSNKFCNSISEPLLTNVKKTTPELILPSHFYGSANEGLEISFSVKTKTGFNGSLLAVVKENNTPIDEMELHFNKGVCEVLFRYGSSSTGVKELTIIVEGNEYINTVQGNIQVTIGNITRELVDNATTFTNSFEFLDTLPSDLTRYKPDDVIITADNTGENTIHIIDTEVESTANNVYKNYTKNSMQIKIGRWSDNAGEDNTELKLNYKSDAIYAKIYCDNPLFDYSNREVIIIINNIPYKRTTDKNGKTNPLNINLEKGTYVIQTFIKGYEGMNSANTMKLVTVV